ncbi:hypothetical protein SLEP1_g52720 [Rubroshorea leprosula]|uniref:Uncharacterized protein n=1 Tax=Rubroshorea leprosula TaxID=152421 RepID=A0AAV5M7A8_9ROSI|nr:hypothetical protein SLEP1_g52720 [Rubroshorea leprosula]
MIAKGVKKEMEMIVEGAIAGAGFLSEKLKKLEEVMLDFVWINLGKSVVLIPIISGIVVPLLPCLQSS